MRSTPVEAAGLRAHWDDVYRRLGPEKASWYQAIPTTSLELIETIGVDRSAGIIDVGGGASPLAATLTGRGFADLTVLDLSTVALAAAAGTGPDPVRRLQGDVRHWTPDRRYDLWHDRAVFHFLTDPADRARYAQVLRQASHPGSHVIVATFAPDGPTSCSGLPVCRYEPDELTAALGGGLHLLVTRHADHTTPGGATQPFTWIAAHVREPHTRRATTG